MIEIIVKIIDKIPNVTGFAINYNEYVDLLSFGNSRLIDINTDVKALSVNHPLGCTVLGRSIYIFKEIENEHFRIDIDNKLRWSSDINILDVDKIDRILKLQSFA